MLIGVLSGNCHAQDDGQRGCSATLDEAKYSKPRPKKYTVAVRWRPAPVGIQVQAHLTRGGTEIPHDWMPAGVGWLLLNADSNLQFRVSYGPGAGYTMDIMIPGVGDESCTWN